MGLLIAPRSGHPKVEFYTKNKENRNEKKKKKFLNEVDLRRSGKGKRKKKRIIVKIDLNFKRRLK